MKKWCLAAVITLFVTTSSSCVITTEPPEATLTIVNNSSYAIYELYITKVGRRGWGPDLLGADVLIPGESVRILADCDSYDVRLVDEDGDTCTLTNLELCFEDAIWTLDDAELATCNW